MDRKKFFIFLYSALAITAVMVIIKWSGATNPHLSLGEWEGPAIWWKQGKCSECHKPLDDIKKLTSVLTGGNATSPPKYHRGPYWKNSHGRVKASMRVGCFSCHAVSACDSCHDLAPATHTIGFTKPDGLGTGAQWHAVLARLRPSSCLLCHRNLYSDCTGCHSAAEISWVEEEGRKHLKEWPQLVETFKAGKL